MYVKDDKYECSNKIISNPWCLCIFTSISSDELVRPVSTETACNLQCCMLILGGVFWPFLDYIPSFLVRSQQSFLGSILILLWPSKISYLIRNINLCTINKWGVLLIVSPYINLPSWKSLKLRWIFIQKAVSVFKLKNVVRIKSRNRSCSAKFVFWQQRLFFFCLNMSKF